MNLVLKRERIGQRILQKVKKKVIYNSLTFIMLDSFFYKKNQMIVRKIRYYKKISDLSINSYQQI